MSDHSGMGPKPERDDRDVLIRKIKALRQDLATVRRQERDLRAALARESAERRVFKAIADRSDDFIAVCTPELETVFVNDAGREMVGLALSAEPHHRPLLDYFWPEDRIRIENETLPALMKSQPWSGEIRLRHLQNGEPIDTFWKAFPIKDDKGQIRAFAAVAPKVEQLKKIQAALQESENALRVIFNATYDGILVHKADGAILDINQTARRMYGLDSTPLSFLRIADISAPSMPLETLSTIWEKTLQGEPQLFEWKAKRVDRNEEFQVEVYLCRIRLRGQDLVLANIRDITERKAAEQALQQSEATYRAIGESIPYGIWVTDPEGGVIYLSDSFLDLVGMTLEQIQPFGWTSRLPPEDIERTLADWKACIRHDCFWDYEHRIRAADNDYRWILSRGVPIRDHDGQVLRWAGINLDITRLKRTETSLRQANEELERFANLASHDLKAPLRAVHELSSWIEEEVSEHLSEPGRARMRLLRERVKLMDDLINAILDYSRAGTETSDITDVETLKLVGDVVKMHGVPEGFTVSIAPDLPRFKTDRLHLQQVFAHLIGNAIEHHNRPDGNVWVSFRDVGDKYEFSVVDDGPGIPDEYRDHLFEVFRGGPVQTTGIGIGLAAVRRILERMGGEVHFKSTLGRGSLFRFTWPKVIQQNENQRPDNE